MSDVYIGFMDEEVRPILDALFTQGWNVLVIERNNIEPNGVLFERPIAAYSKPVMWKGWCGISERPDSKGEFITVHNTYKDSGNKLNPNRRTWLDVFQQCVFMNFLEVYKKLPSRVLEEENGKLVKRKLGLLPSLSMLYMGTASGRDSGLPTKILIRSPEMGMQPGLIRTQLRGLLKSIKRASHATQEETSIKEANKLNLWCYGAGGAYRLPTDNPAGGPGKVWDIKGSIYIGVERDKSAESRRKAKGTVSLYTGEISYCSESTEETLYTSPTYYFTEQARVDVQKMFIDSATANNLLTSQITPIQQDTGVGTTKPPNRAGISITANTFIGGDIKEAAKVYGLKGEVNMEDYHLLKLVYSMKSSQEKFISVKSIENEYPILKDVRIVRIDADPAEVVAIADVKSDSPTYNGFKEANETEIKASNYAEIIGWGLQGMQFDVIPDSIDWKKIATFIGTKVNKENVDKYLVAYKESNGDENAKYMNPFLLEAAQDMFREVGEWLQQVQKEDSETEHYVSAINRNPFNISGLETPAEQTARMDGLLKAYNDLNMQLSQFCNGNKDAITREACEGFVTSLYSYLSKSIVEPDSDVKIWARGGWGAGKAQPSFVENVSYSGSTVDRALYKSTNSTVLNKNAKDAVENYFT
ncbi:hypothetical protein FKG94_21450 [Exilibacterium tricleocarpae]|uniref:Uncharacterized protein n=1 Tax=Exilibacterium tricleocarpae TaxID=2591008 RepID=A0A545T042_9GAMM|nr:hypothetical protein [Exilibacterium tricleocarpae]TQV70588.1 hypothetical protein FKG94_21450 [Exilibacterium tricleocarpae]